jgi:hypothetical protein
MFSKGKVPGCGRALFLVGFMIASKGAELGSLSVRGNEVSAPLSGEGLKWRMGGHFHKVQRHLPCDVPSSRNQALLIFMFAHWSLDHLFCPLRGMARKALNSVKAVQPPQRLLKRRIIPPAA